MSIGSVPFLATGTPPSSATGAQVSGGAARRNHQASAGVFTASLGLGPEERDFGFEESDGRSFSALFDEGTRQQASSGGGRGRPTLGFSEVASDPDAASDSGDAGAHRQDVTVAGPPPVQSRRFVVIRGAASGEAGTSDTTVNVTSNQGASAQPQPEAATERVQAELGSPIELIAHLRRTQTIQVGTVVETQPPGTETSAARAPRFQATEVVVVAESAESNVPPTIAKGGLEGSQVVRTARPNPNAAAPPTETGRQQPVALVPQVRPEDGIPLTDQPRPPAAHGRSSSEGATAQAPAETTIPKQEGSVPLALRPGEKPSTAEAERPHDRGQKAARQATRPDSSAENATARQAPKPSGARALQAAHRDGTKFTRDGSVEGTDRSVPQLQPEPGQHSSENRSTVARDQVRVEASAPSTLETVPPAVLPESLQASGPVPEATPQRPRATTSEMIKIGL